MQKPIYHVDPAKLDAFANSPDLPEEEEIRQIWIHGPRSQSSCCNYAINPSELSNYVQIWKPYNQSRTKCKTGYTPVAWGIIYEYWDRHGYPFLVGETEGTDNRRTLDKDVQAMFDELRTDMQTSCGGGTTLDLQLDGLLYTHRRGYGFDASYVTVPDRYSTTKRELQAQRPLLINYDAGSEDHTAVVYFLHDEGSLKENFVRIKTGWQSPPTRRLDDWQGIATVLTIIWPPTL